MKRKSPIFLPLAVPSAAPPWQPLGGRWRSHAGVGARTASIHTSERHLRCTRLLALLVDFFLIYTWKKNLSIGCADLRYTRYTVSLNGTYIQPYLCCQVNTVMYTTCTPARARDSRLAASSWPCRCWSGRGKHFLVLHVHIYATMLNIYLEITSLRGLLLCKTVPYTSFSSSCLGVNKMNTFWTQTWCYVEWLEAFHFAIRFLSVSRKPVKTVWKEKCFLLFFYYVTLSSRFQFFFFGLSVLTSSRDQLVIQHVVGLYKQYSLHQNNADIWVGAD